MKGNIIFILMFGTTCRAQFEPKDPSSNCHHCWALKVRAQFVTRNLYRPLCSAVCIPCRRTRAPSINDFIVVGPRPPDTLIKCSFHAYLHTIQSEEPEPVGTTVLCGTRRSQDHLGNLHLCRLVVVPS